jgi:hypothetical protein
MIWYHHGYLGSSTFDNINSGKALLAGLGTAFGCGTFTGINLYMLFDRRNTEQSNGSGQAGKANKSKQG